MRYHILISIVWLTTAVLAGCGQPQPTDAPVLQAENRVPANAPVQQLDDATFHAGLDPTDERIVNLVAWLKRKGATLEPMTNAECKGGTWRVVQPQIPDDYDVVFSIRSFPRWSSEAQMRKSLDINLAYMLNAPSHLAMSYAGFQGRHPDAELPKSDEELPKLNGMPVTKAIENLFKEYDYQIKIENSQGFETLTEGKLFRQLWEKQDDNHRMHGAVADRLTKEQIDRIIMLEMNIAVAVSPHSPSLQDELLRFMTEGNRFLTGRLPDSFDKSPRKHLVAIIRMKNRDDGNIKDGDFELMKREEYGLITLYRDFAVIELKGLIGVAPVTIEEDNQPLDNATETNGAYALEIIRGGGLPPPNAPGAEFEHYSFKVAEDGSWEFRYGVFTTGGIKRGKLSVEELQRWIKDIEGRGFHTLKSNPHLGKADETYLYISIPSEGNKMQKRIDMGEKLSQAIHKKIVELAKPGE